MNIVDECNFLRRLYQSKYYQQTTVRNNIRHAQDLKNRLSFFKQTNQKHYSQQISKKSSPQFSTKKNKKIHVIQYCNQQININTLTLKHISRNKFRRKSVSVTAYRQNSKTKQQHWLADVKNSILHSKQSHLENAIKQKKSKIKLQKTINQQISKTIQNKQLNMQRPHKTQINFHRNSLADARRKVFSVLRNRSSQNKNKTHQNRRDENDVLPWNTDIQQLF